MATRDKHTTKRKLVESLIAMIRENGFEDVGVNSVADRAGVSKVLIYRYFGGLDGLLREAADRIDPLQADAADALLRQLDSDAPVREIVKRTILDLHRALDNDELSKALLSWELTNQNSLTRAFSLARERTGLRLTEALRARLGQAPDGVDLNAILAILTAGIFYLTLRGDTVDEYNGIEISSNTGWERIAEAVADLVDVRTGGQSAHL